MAQRTLIGGTTYKINGGKTLVNGTAYSIKNGNTLVGGTAYEVVLEKEFADYTWEEIITACQNKVIPNNWVVGDQKTMTIDGAEYLIDIIGKNHDNYSDGSGTAPLTFQLHSVYKTDYKINDNWSNAGGYDSMPMYATHLPDFLGKMPSVVQSAIKLVNKKSSIGDTNTDIETIACNVFLLSEIEVFGSVTNSALGEGTQYEYYSDGNSAIKHTALTTATRPWWTRSPALKNNRAWCIVTNSGTPDTEHVANSCRFAPAFCF